VLEIDAALRRPGVIVNRKLDRKLYLHESCLPIDQIDFAARVKANAGKPKQLGLWQECTGMCGM